MAFSYYKSVTIDHTQCGSANTSNFPVTIWVTDADLKTVGNGGYVQSANGYDIRPFLDVALTDALSFELVLYTATTGALEMHVSISILSGSDVVFYLAFGDSSIVTDGSSTATWQNTFVCVYHFANGTSLALTDSTSSALTLSQNSGVNLITAAAGQVDGAAKNATSSVSAYLKNTGGPAITAGSAITVSWWNYVPVERVSSAFTVGNSDDPQRIQAHAPYADNVLYWDYGTFSTGRVSTSYAGFTAAWTLIHLVFNPSGNLHEIYLNGVQKVSSANSNTPSATQTGVYVFAFPAIGFGDTDNALIDEFRVATAARSQSWITAEYNNQKASSTFLTFGTRTPVPPATRMLAILGVG